VTCWPRSTRRPSKSVFVADDFVRAFAGLLAACTGRTPEQSVEAPESLALIACIRLSIQWEAGHE
jgi:hypothetical protein